MFILPKIYCYLKNIFILFNFLVIFHFTVKASVFTIENDDAVIPISKNCSCFVDTSSQYTINTIVNQKAQFEKCNDLLFYRQLHHEVRWYSFSIENSSFQDKQIVLSLSNPYLKDVEIYTVVGSIRKYEGGFKQYEYDEKQPFIDNFNNITIILKKSSTTDFFIRVNNAGDFIQFPISAYSVSEFKTKSYNYNIFNGFFYGVTLIFLFVIIARFYSMRDELYYHFVGYIIVSIIRFSITDRLLFHLSPIPIQYETQMLCVFSSLSIFFFLGITKKLLQIPRLSVLLNRIISVYQYLGLLIINLIFWTTPIFNIHLLMAITVLIIIVSVIFGIMYRRRNSIFYILIFILGVSGIFLSQKTEILATTFASSSLMKICEISINLILLVAVFDRLQRKKEDLSLILKHRNKQISDQKIELERKNEELQQKIKDYQKSEEERISLQEQLIQSQKMETIGRLAGSIAHDFNNILTPIIGHTDLALELLPDDSDVRDDLELVIKASFRAKDLINQILTFSRDIKEEVVAVNVDSIINEVLMLIKPSLSSDINVVSTHDDESSIIEATPTRIQQVVMNICSNASDAMSGKGGDLIIARHTKQIKKGEFATLPSGRYICIEISDTGQGIEEGMLTRIFEPFFTTKKAGKGTGLGLAVVHGIVKNSGGDIFVRSKIGQGTSFKIFFPASNASVAEDKLYSDSKEIAGFEKILIVDDEEVITTMLRQQLGKLGFKITVKNNGQAALDEFTKNQNHFDMLITDQRMPGLNGDELVLAVKKIAKHIKIIMITGYSEKVDNAFAKELGISELVLKPFDPKEFACTIRRVLDAR